MTAKIARTISRLKRMTRIGAIGLDIGARQIKAVQLLHDVDGAWSLRAAASIPRIMTQPDSPLHPAEAERIVDVLFRRGFVGNDLVVAVPDAKMLATNLELPPRTNEIPLDQIARAEFARSLKVESEQIEFGYWDLPAPARAAKATHVMGVGCRHADCSPILDAFESIGYELKSIEVEAVALARACFPVCAPPSDITAIVDIGFTAVRLMVVHQGVVIYQRSLSAHGMSHIVKLLAEQFGGRDALVNEQMMSRLSLRSGSKLGENLRRPVQAHFDDVAAEITTSLAYSGHQYPDASVRRVLLCGGGASMDGLAAHLAEKLGVETLVVNSSDLVKIADDDWRNSPSLTLAIGLAGWQGESN